MASDGTLLQEYVQSGSESAFAEVVRRHVALVYSTALRGVGGDPHLAKDVSQSVFIDLARKAQSLSNRTVLTGWLYRSACFAAAKTVRSERRRATREWEAQAMQEPLAGPAQEPDWQQIGPVLNTVMLELKESDREVLLLRFFERRSLAEVGEKIGLGENAARMRVERALERLRNRLTRRGITSTAAGLVLVLGHQTMVAAPVGLAASITAVSLASAATTSASSLLTLLIMSKTKALLVGALLAAGVGSPIALQYGTNARLRAEIEALRAEAAERTAAQPISIEPGELERQRREHEELIRLRGEVTAARQRVAATPRGKAETSEFGRLKAVNLAKMAREAAEAQVALAKSPEIPILPANSWANVGFTTPASTLQTLNWAAAHQDTNAFLGGMSWDPQARARADELFAALPEAVRQKYGSADGVIMDWMISHATPVASYRVLSQTEQGPTDVTLLEQHQYTDERVRENSVQFHQDETGNWRQVLPQELMPKLEVVINSLAGGTTSPAAGK